MRKFFYLIALIGFAGCTLDDGENQISCGIPPDGELLDRTSPSDSVFVRIESNQNSALNKSWLGVIDQDLSDSAGFDIYQNVFLKTRSASTTLEELTGVGTELIDQVDSSTFTISFDFIERNIGAQVCRFNKTVRKEHFYSIWSKSNEGARIDITIKDGENETFYTTDYDHELEDDVRINIISVEVLDEAMIFGEIRGFFTAKVKDPSSDSNPITVSGEFQYLAQIGYGIDL